MGVPAAEANLDESDPGLRHSSGGKALSAESACGFIVQAVQITDGLWFFGHINDFRQGVLHAEREFVGADHAFDAFMRPSGITECGLIQSLHQIQLLPLGGPGQSR